MTRIALVIATALCLLAPAAALAGDQEWKDSYRKHVAYVIKIDGRVVAAGRAKNWSVDREAKQITFKKLTVFSPEFAALLYRSDGELVQAFTISRIKEKDADGKHDDVKTLKMVGGSVVAAEAVEATEMTGLPWPVQNCEFRNVKIGYTNVELF